jgi:predicted secreted Zn-dependent protease
MSSAFAAAAHRCWLKISRDDSTRYYTLQGRTVQAETDHICFRRGPMRHPTGKHHDHAVLIAIEKPIQETG